MHSGLFSPQNGQGAIIADQITFLSPKMHSPDFPAIHDLYHTAILSHLLLLLIFIKYSMKVLRQRKNKGKG
jgi:hypothetical protein